MRPSPIARGLPIVLLAALQACIGENQAAAPNGSDPIVKGGDDRFGDYEAVAQWWKPAPNHDSVWGWGSMSDVAVDNPDRILAVHWGDRKRNGEAGAGKNNFIVAADRNGNITEVWTKWDSILQLPHVIRISPYDPER